MAKKKEEWLTVREAAELLSERSGHTISPNYVRYLAYGSKKEEKKYVKVRTKPLDGRTMLYSRADLEKITVKQKEPTKKGPADDSTTQSQ